MTGSLSFVTIWVAATLSWEEKFGVVIIFRFSRGRIHSYKLANNSSGSIRLVTCSSIPVAIFFSSSPAMAWAVIAMIVYRIPDFKFRIPREAV